MLFNSYTFLIFFAIVLGLHSLPISWRLRKLNLLLASYVFYAAWSPPFVLLLWFSTIVDWFVARALDKSESAPRRRALLGVSLASNLGLLGFFKYGEFLTQNFASMLQAVGIDFQPASLDIVLPVGISFYTFQTLSYTFDVYRRRARPWHSFLDYALYVTFFPQLVAGPIVRSTDFLPQCVEPRRASRRQLSWGLSLLVLGLFEKVVVADGLLAPISDKLYGATGEIGSADAWLGTLAFSGQVFCDFAGYSTCAIGVAMCLGFVIQDNFRFPFAAIGFSDLWQRWHVSLSTWMRDYLYIPLGGNRKGRWKAYRNLMLTMLLAGLWHGAAWNYVAWGGFHGLLLATEQAIMSRRSEPLAAIGRSMRGFGLAMLTHTIWLFTLVVFRSTSFDQTFALVGCMFGAGCAWAPSLLKGTQVLLVIGVTTTMLALHWTLRDSSVEQAAAKLPWIVRSLLLAGMLIAIVTMSGDSRAFIYFQF